MGERGRYASIYVINQYCPAPYNGGRSISLSTLTKLAANVPDGLFHLKKLAIQACPSLLHDTATVLVRMFHCAALIIVSADS
jgi:hypothetical protein